MNLDDMPDPPRKNGLYQCGVPSHAPGHRVYSAAVKCLQEQKRKPAPGQSAKPAFAVLAGPAPKPQAPIMPDTKPPGPKPPPPSSSPPPVRKLTFAEALAEALQAAEELRAFLTEQRPYLSKAAAGSALEKVLQVSEENLARAELALARIQANRAAQLERLNKLAAQRDAEFSKRLADFDTRSQAKVPELQASVAALEAKIQALVTGGVPETPPVENPTPPPLPEAFIIGRARYGNGHLR
jgi:hypothetical protein